MSRGLFLRAAVFAILSLPTFCLAQEVTIKKSQPKVGDVLGTTEHSSSANDIKLFQKGKLIQTLKQKAEELRSDTITILACDGDKIRKLKVHVKKNEKKQSVGVGPDSKKSLLVGKTFILEKKGETIVATDESGKKLADDMAKEARYEYADELGEYKNEFNKIIPDRALKVGETIKVPEKMAQSFFNSKQEKSPLKVTHFTLTLKGTKKVNNVDVAIFDILVKFSGSPAAGSKVSVEMKGPLHIGVNNCYPYLMNISGTMTIEGKEQGLDIKGAGQNKLKKTGSYTKSAKTKQPKSGQK